MMTSEETTIVFGPNNESGAASLTKSRQKRGEALSMITCKHAHELQLPSQSMARCDMLFAHFLPAAKNSLVTRENIKEEIVEWVGRVLSEISFGSDAVDTPILDVTPATSQTKSICFSCGLSRLSLRFAFEQRNTWRRNILSLEVVTEMEKASGFDKCVETDRARQRFLS